jgi:hypothetical protein
MYNNYENYQSIQKIITLSQIIRNDQNKGIGIYTNGKLTKRVSSRLKTIKKLLEENK